MDRVHYICKLDKSLYSIITGDIASDEVIITDTQIRHIQERHPDDYERFVRYAKNVIESPDYIIEANKPDSGVLLKEVVENGEKLYLVLRLKTLSDPKEYKNSVITFTKIKPKEWRRMLRNKKILYKSKDK